MNRISLHKLQYSTAPKHTRGKENIPTEITATTVDRFDPPSGMARLQDDQFLVVHDTKSNDLEGPRLSLYGEAEGTLQRVDVDWSRTGLPSDLEAITKLDADEDLFLAVEGSRYRGHTPQLFLLQNTENGIAALDKVGLPELPFDIEGLAVDHYGRNKTRVMLGGRGGDGQPGRLHWADYDRPGHTLQWNSKAGLEGVPVTLPSFLGQSQRSISDLLLDESGQLWASATTDPGDEGPFDSLVYRVGLQTSDAEVPIRLTEDRAMKVDTLKVEAVASSPFLEHAFLLGADNEASGGLYALTPLAQ